MLPRRAAYAGWILVPIIVGLSLAAFALWTPIPASSARRSVDVTMRQFEFDPPTIEVRKGDAVTVHLTAMDLEHGFALDGYPVAAHVAPMESAEVTFVADRVGTFRFRCAVTCGALHPFMIGELVVEPNLPYGYGIAVLVATGVVAFVWSSRREEAAP